MTTTLSSYELPWRTFAVSASHYAPPLIVRGIKRWCYLTSVWRLSVAYIWPKSRTEKPRKTEIATEVDHVTRDTDTTFKVQRSKVKVTRPLYTPPCWRVRQLQRSAWDVLAVGNCCYVAVRSAARGASAPTGQERGGAYRGGRPPTACYISFFSLPVIFTSRKSR